MPTALKPQTAQNVIHLGEGNIAGSRKEHEVGCMWALDFDQQIATWSQTRFQVPGYLRFRDNLLALPTGSRDV